MMNTVYRRIGVSRMNCQVEVYREGLTRARLAGARNASGDVVVFLDSHCEASHDWLRPLLQRIKERKSAVVTPIIDMLETNTLEYNFGTSITEFEV